MNQKPAVFVTNFNPRFTGVSATTAAVCCAATAAAAPADAGQFLRGVMILTKETKVSRGEKEKRQSENNQQRARE